jgi:hypothetical protein
LRLCVSNKRDTRNFTLRSKTEQGIIKTARSLSGASTS